MMKMQDGSAPTSPPKFSYNTTTNIGLKFTLTNPNNTSSRDYHVTNINNKSCTSFPSSTLIHNRVLYSPLLIYFNGTTPTPTNALELYALNLLDLKI